MTHKSSKKSWFSRRDKTSVIGFIRLNIMEKWKNNVLRDALVHFRCAESPLTDSATPKHLCRGLPWSIDICETESCHHTRLRSTSIGQNVRDAFFWFWWSLSERIPSGTGKRVFGRSGSLHFRGVENIFNRWHDPRNFCRGLPWFIGICEIKLRHHARLRSISRNQNVRRCSFFGFDDQSLKGFL